MLYFSIKPLGVLSNQDAKLAIAGLTFHNEAYTAVSVFSLEVDRLQINASI